MSDYDAVVIGAGLNGLASAVMLARAGWNVLVVEAASEPGGACKTAEITRQGFKHDLFATNAGLFRSSPLYAEFKQELHARGFEFVSASRPFSSVFPEDRQLTIHRDPDATRKSIRTLSRADALAWDRLVEYYERVAPTLHSLLQSPMPSPAWLKSLGTFVLNQGFTAIQELAADLLKCPRDFLEERFETREMRSLLAPWAFHLDFGPDVPGGAVYSFLKSVSEHKHGMAYVKQGSGRIVDALVDVFHSQGGHLRTDTPVDEILLERKLARGIRTEDGESITARRAVIANLTPDQLFLELVGPGHLPDDFVRRVRNYRFGPGSMMLHMSLDGPLPWKAGESLHRSGCIHVGPYLDDMARTYQQVQAGLLPDSPLLIVCQPTAVDPSRAPEGRHILWVQVRALPHTIRGDAADEITGTSWPQVKEPFCERILDKLSRYAPNMRERILDRVVITPRGLQEHNKNLRGGDTLGGSHHLDQNYLFRPLPGWSRYETPIRNLFMTGASTWPGAGLNATSGYLLARKLGA